MKAALAFMTLVVACPAIASDPRSEQRLEFIESAAEKTRTAMKQLRRGTSEAEVRRRLRLRSEDAILMEGEPGHTLEMHFVDERHRLFVSFQPNKHGSRELVSAELFRGPSEIIAKVGD